MNVIKYFIALLLFSIALQSCSTTEKFAVISNTNATLYMPQGKTKVADIQSGKKTKLSFDSDAYYGYCLMKVPGSDTFIPMGLDVHKKSHNGAKLASITGMTLGVAGTAAAVGGMIVCAASGSESMVPAVGAGALGVGAAIGVPATSRLEQLAYNYQFTYDKEQRFDIIKLSPTLLRKDEPKELPVIEVTEDAAPRRRKAQSGADPVAVQPTKSKRSLNDFGKVVAGTYYGNGCLTNGNVTEETYSDISMIVERIDKTHVRVRIIESGEDFFESPITYTVKKNSRNGYKLEIPGLPQATISITKDGNAKFVHKKVNIDNEIYTLVINAVLED